MQGFNEQVRRRRLIAIAICVGLAFLLGLNWINQNNCDLVGNVERHDCDLSKLND